MNKLQKIIIGACLLWATQTCLAQDFTKAGDVMINKELNMPAPLFHPFYSAQVMPMNPGGLMLHKLTPPMVIMQHQEEIGLTEKQINTIKNEMKAFQSEIVDVQWDLHAGKAGLEKGFDTEKIDLKEALKSIDKVLDAENRLKRQHLSLLIKIHNVLTAEQQEILKGLQTMFMTRMRMRHAPAVQLIEKIQPDSNLLE